MKNIIKNIAIVILAIIAIISITFNVITIVRNNIETYNMSHSNLEAYLKTTEQKIVPGTNSYNDEDLSLYNDISTANLAVLVSNKDYPVDFIDIVAKNHGYEGYTDMVTKLIEWDLLVYIPEYEHPEYGVMQENIVTPNTVGYELAVEEGIIKEVK
jgi:hypothetical protein